jgi:hypothetical protein
MDDRFIELALDAGLLNYIDHETPRRYFINGHADLKDVAKFAELVVWETRQEAANEIERLREENARQRQEIMLLNSMIQTEHEIIRVAALKEDE